VNCDCFELIEKITDGSIDLLYTDPPYQQAITGGGNIAKKFDYRMEDLKKISSFNPKDFLAAVKPKMKLFHAYIWTSKNLLKDYIEFAESNSFNWDLLVWAKRNPIPAFNNSYMSDLEFCVFIREKGGCFFDSTLGYENYKKCMVDNVADNKNGHPTQKYEWMVSKMIRTSTKEGDIIFDPFGGSFTTAMVCQSLKRDFISCELEEKYCTMGEERLKQDVLF
jgi:DNA modification methylase